MSDHLTSRAASLRGHVPRGSAAAVGGGLPVQASRWQASLDIDFAYRRGRTLPVQLRHRGPLRTQRAFYPEGAHCHLYILHPPGGVVGGDMLDMTFTLDQGAGVLLTMPGATKVYRSNGGIAEIHQCFRVADSARLEWLPPASIFFNGARARQVSEFHLTSGARLMARETLCLGRPVMDESFTQGEVRTELRVHIDERPVLIERLCVRSGLAVLAGYAFTSTLLIYPGNPQLRDELREVLADYDEPAGVTLVDGLLIVRLLAHSNLRLDAIQEALWRRARPDIMALAPVPPRIWAT